ncbi:glycoside hydrolase family 16 protein [Dothistroma septosporum NZE10]|uniref:Glycoside hydrolase family 16 protein n=1 Tax=Dothistroma septosporum (strain NZE10 / CBS 128990) TaxID=675120 RepID=N1PUK1_DOTSN|nr:glycoside hydrolase family 16 protein [Dothistroma septosporum NZE10]
MKLHFRYVPFLACLTKSALAQWASTTTFTFEGNTLPTGLVVSTDTINDRGSNSDAKFNHQFNASNVQVQDGYLELAVPGGQTTSPIQCAEVSTDFEVMYASVSTYAILVEEAGVCNGMFFYHSDSQEIDIEWISDVNSTSNQNTNNGTRVMQYTNQGPHGTADSSEVDGMAASNATEATHEYRLDWVNGASSFFLDGVFQYELNSNVPTTAGNWIWNNWADGGPSFTVGPPASDAVFRIQKIVMHYNTTADDQQSGTPSAGNGTASGGHSGAGTVLCSPSLALAVAFSVAVSYLLF